MYETSKTNKFMSALLAAIGFVMIGFVTIACADDMGEIHSAETKTGGIHVASETDAFSFAGKNGQTAIIRMSRPICCVDPEIRLYDKTMTLIAQSQTSETSTEITAVLTDSSLYTIVVSDWGADETGGYSLSLLLIPGATTSPQDSNGGGLLPGETRIGAMGPHADTDAYTFSGQEGDNVQIRMSRTICCLDPEIRLYDEAQNLIEVGYSLDTSFEISKILAQTGTYTIVVSDFGGDETGGYKLSFARQPTIQHSPTVRIELNQEQLSPGSALTFSEQIKNGPIKAEIERKAWIHFPTGEDKPLQKLHRIMSINPNENLSLKRSVNVLTGTEPPGTYTIGVRLLDPITGSELSSSTDTFLINP